MSKLEKKDLLPSYFKAPGSWKSDSDNYYTKIFHDCLIDDFFVVDNVVTISILKSIEISSVLNKTVLVFSVYQIDKVIRALEKMKERKIKLSIEFKVFHHLKDEYYIGRLEHLDYAWNH